jgi:uncharacterized HAD superfamily protein
VLPTIQRIYVDLDDVLCETARAFLVLLETHFGKTATFDGMYSFNLAESFSLNPRELARLMSLAHEDGVLKHLAIIPGAKQGLDTFTSMGYDIIIVTGRPPSTEEATQFWLDANGIPYQQLIFVDKYGRSSTDVRHRRAMTLDELSQMTFVYAVEDSRDMAIFLSDHMGLAVALLDRPWNRINHHNQRPLSPKVKRFADWSEIRNAPIMF